MFTAYVDDSGTDPAQKVAIASGLVVPAARIIAFDSEWAALAEKWGFSDFHASECAAANPKSDFSGWNGPRIKAAFQRIRQITKKYAARCFSLAVNKADYDAVMPPDLRAVFGNYHYTWAMHSLLALLDGWACQSGAEHPLEYVFDWINPKSQRDQKLEIEEALDRNEGHRPGRFAGHYSFCHRKKYPGLQCADLVGWTCYRYALNVHRKAPLTPLQRECWKDFGEFRKSGDEWLTAIGQTRQQIQQAVDFQRRHYGAKLSPVKPHIAGSLSRQLR
jgi:hypothetical protein